MPRKCCVFNCSGNYDYGCKVSVFRLPTKKDEREKWLSAIPRDNIPDTKNTVICEQHWPENYPKVCHHGKLRPLNPPSIFNCVSKSLVPTTPSTSRCTEKAHAESRRIQNMDELSSFNEQDIIPNFEHLVENISQLNLSFLSSDSVVSFSLEKKLTIQSKKFIEGTGIPEFSLHIFDDLMFKAFHCGVESNIDSLATKNDFRMNRWSCIEEAVRYLHCMDTSHKKEVLLEQIKAMSHRLNSRCQKKYMDQSIIRSFEYFSLSRSSYNRFREDFELPSTKTLTRLTSTVKNTEDSQHLKNVFGSVTNAQKSCILLIDEVYVKPVLQYHGGSLFGQAVNNPALLANTLLSFMIICLFGGPKFLCKMIPVRQLNAKFQFEQCQHLKSLIKEAGGNLIAVICDGNRTNQSFFKMFETLPGSPWRTKDDIFLLFDYVHLLKSVRNNWITEKSQELRFIVDDNELVAKWSDLVKLHKFEQQNLVKLSKLSDRAVAPTPIERQKVSTCLQVFCDETISALKTHPKLSQDICGTVSFLQTFVDFWKIVNVHGSYEDVKFNDSRRSVVRRESDKSLQFLADLGHLVKSMSPKVSAASSGKRRYKSLTNDTSSNFSHTCFALVELTKYLLSKGHDYVLLGCFTTDPLEKEFSKLRQGSGGAYFISVQQALEKHVIRKTKLMLGLDAQCITESSHSAAGHSCSKCGFMPEKSVCEIIDCLPLIEPNLSKDVKMSLVYIAGYVVRQDQEIAEDTFNIYSLYGSYLSDLNRGLLKIPGDSVCQWSFFCYIVFHEVVDHTCVASLASIFQMISDLYSLRVSSRHCRILSNIFFNNYCHFISPRSDKEPRRKILKLGN